MCLPIGEFEIVNHFAIGLKPSQICELMGLQPSTVATYKKKIFEKLGIQSDFELYALAKEHRL